MKNASMGEFHLRVHAAAVVCPGPVCSGATSSASDVLGDAPVAGNPRDLLVGFLSRIGCSGYGVREFAPEAGEHFHFAIRCEKSLPTFRKAFVRQFPSCSGNKSYSLESARDFERLRRYLAKGSSVEQMPDVVWRNGLYSDEYIKLWHDEYWAENATIARAKRKATNMMAELEQRCRDKKVAWDDRDAITEEYATVVKEFGKTYDVNLARRTVRGVMCQLCPNDSYRRSMVEQTWY